MLLQCFEVKLSFKKTITLFFQCFSIEKAYFFLCTTQKNNNNNHLDILIIIVLYNIYISPEVLSLTSLITQYVTGRHNATSINLSMTAHGMTRSKVLVEILRKSAVFIRYADIQLLYDFWALQEEELSEESPVELAEGRPSICIYDNDDCL